MVVRNTAIAAASPARFLGRIVSCGCWRGDAAVRQGAWLISLAARAAGSRASPGPMIAASLREMARMAGAARARGHRAVEGVTARPYCVRAQRPIKPGEPHAALAAAGDGKNEDRYDVLISALRP